MFLLLLFSVGLNEVIGPIENNLFRGSRGTVMVTYEQGIVDMQIIKSGKEILVQYLIPRNLPEDSSSDFFSLALPPVSEEMIFQKRNKPDVGKGVIEMPVAYYDGQSFLGRKDIFVSYVFIGYRSALLHLIKKFNNEGSKLVGESGYGHRIEFDRSSKLPIKIETTGKTIVFKGWRKVGGLGYLPEKVEVWIKGKKVGERKIKSVTNPVLGPSYFEAKKKEIPIIAE